MSVRRTPAGACHLEYLHAHIFEQSTAPTVAEGAAVGGVWIDVTNVLLKQCTSISPVTWSQISGDGHVAVTVSDGMHTLSTQLLAGVAASQTQAGHAELATAAEINTGTDTGRVLVVDQFVASNRNVRYILFKVLDPTTAHTVSTTVGGDLSLPFTGTITEVGAWVDTAGTTGLATIDLHLNGTTIMTTNKITIDSTEKTSRTAATAPALTTTAVTVGDIITVDIDTPLQTTAAKGLAIWLGVRQT